MTSEKCPGCGEQNTTEMAFCIYCGAPLKASAERKASVSAARGRTCASCGQTDMLNSQFCIFCGALVEGNMPVSGQNGAGADRGASAPGQDAREQHPASARNIGIAAVVVAGILGAALGLAMSWMGGKDAPPQAAVHLPAEGLTILTTKPHSAVQIDSQDKPSFIAARTGVDGDLSLPNVNPGQYQVTITAPDGEKVQQAVTVPDSGAIIIGGPPGAEIFAKP